MRKLEFPSRFGRLRWESRVGLRGKGLSLEPVGDLPAKTSRPLGSSGRLGDHSGDCSNRRHAGSSLESPGVHNIIYSPNLLECKFCCLLTGFDLELKVFERGNGILDTRGRKVMLENSLYEC